MFSNPRGGALKAARGLRKIGEIDRQSIGDLEIEYWRAGAGSKTIVFIHGNSAGKEVFHHQFATLSRQGYSLLAIDLPGHGGSSDSKSPERDYNFPAFALLVKRLLAALNIETPLLVGWSLGGHVVIEMAGRGFDIAGAMIFGSPPVGPGLGEDFERAFLPSEAMAVTLKENPSSDDLATYVNGLYGSLNPRPEAFARLAERMDGAVRSHMGAHWAAGDEGCHQKTVVAGWDKPICVIHGDEDVFASGDYIVNLKWRNLWRNEVIRMEGVGHAPFVETPDRFNSILSAFSADVFAGPRT